MKITVFENESVSKADIENLATSIIVDIEEGNKDPLKVHIQAKALIDVFSQIAERSLSAAMAEAYKHSDKTFEFIGAKVEFKNTGDRYDFEKDQEYKRIKDSLKAREDLLKQALKSAATLVIDDEVVPKVPIKTPSKATLAVSIK